MFICGFPNCGETRRKLADLIAHQHAEHGESSLNPKDN